MSKGVTMADVFISYSHRDQLFALQLVGALAQREYTAWFDKNDVFPAGEFREDIKAGIEEAGAFIFILSPDSIVSEECGKELDYAQACGKKLIPLLHRGIDPSHAPQALRELDWIEDASFDRLLEKVLDTLLTDKDDWKQAGRWLRSASEWDKNHKHHSGLLLHGKELKKAEDWLKKATRWRLEGSNKKPQPLLHVQFIRKSRRDASRFFLARMIVLFLFVSLTAGGAFRFLYHDPTLVTIPNDDGPGSLRWCINNAPSGSTITFDESVRGTIKLTSGDMAFPGGKKLIIRGPGANILAISSGTANFRIHVLPKASVTISSLIFKNSTLIGKGLILNEGVLQLINSTVSGNSVNITADPSFDSSSSGYGGGISNIGSGTVSLINSTVSGNSVKSVDGTYYSNSPNYGGGISNSGSGTVSLINSTVSGNSVGSIDSGGYGGGISNIGSGTVSLINSTVSGNSSITQGGTAGSGNGGGIYNNAMVSLINSTVSDNSIDEGATSVFSYGGGIDNNGMVSLINSTLSGNSIHQGYGGGIYNGGMVSLINSTLYANSAIDSTLYPASAEGGGIFTFSVPPSRPSYWAKNQQAGDVSQNSKSCLSSFGKHFFLLTSECQLSYDEAFSQSSVAEVDVTFSTIFDNTASQGGGIYSSKYTDPSSGFITTSKVTIRNSIVIANHASTDPNISGPLTSDGYNLMQNITGATLTPNIGDQFIPDPSSVFASNVQLSNTGGPTQTLALLLDPRNPALNAIPLSACQIKEIYDTHLHMYTDQRGRKRPGGKKTACDIGAYEL
jgi:TIR domain